jgi:hypothetical protein
MSVYCYLFGHDDDIVYDLEDLVAVPTCMRCGDENVRFMHNLSLEDAMRVAQVEWLWAFEDVVLTVGAATKAMSDAFQSLGSSIAEAFGAFEDALSDLFFDKV